jgi:hypothetical protein
VAYSYVGSQYGTASPVTYSPTNGNSVFVFTGISGAATAVTFADTASDVPATVFALASFANGFKAACAWFPAVSTPTGFSASVTGGGVSEMVVVEYSGLNTAGLVGCQSGYTAAPGTGTNVVSGGIVTPSSGQVPCMVLGMTFDATGNPATAGTGFTIRRSSVGQGMSVEDLRATVAAAQQVFFSLTGGGGNNFITLTVVVSEFSQLPVGTQDNNYVPPASSRAFPAHRQEFWQMPLEIRSAPPTAPPAFEPSVDLPPKPFRPPLPTAALGIEENLLLGTLYGQDSVLTPAQWNYKWPDPLSRMPNALRAESHGFTANDMTALTSPAPYYEYNWPNPPAPRQPQRSWEFSFPLELIGKDQFYGAPGQGPQNLPWDPPAGKPFPLENRTWIDEGLALRHSPAVQPPPNIDWPVPAFFLRKRPVDDWIFGMPEALQATLLVFPPPSNKDWPVPLAPRRSLELLTWAYNGSLHIAPPGPLPPGQQLEAPTPRKQPYRDLGFEFRTPITLPIITPIFAGRVEWTAKVVGETVFRYIDFTDRLAAGEEVINLAVEVSVWSGNDPSPAIISGVNLLDNTAGIPAVAQLTVTGGVLGTIYEVLVTAATNLANSISKAAAIAIVPPFN